MSTALGWDIHRKFSLVSVQELTADGELRTRERRRLEHEDRESMKTWLHSLPQKTPVALEATFGWPWIAELLEECGLDPHLAHPPAVRVLAKHEAKGDRCDADRLARLRLQGILPESYLAPHAVRQLRERIRFRTSLVALRTGVKNRIHAQLHRLGILHHFSDLFGKRGREFLKQLQLPEATRGVLDDQVELLDLLEEQITEIETWMEANLQDDDVVRLLITIPGIGRILAHVIRAEIGEIERFGSRRHLNSYAGLAPLSDDSAERHGRRHCSPHCNHTLRWALIEAAGAVVGSKRTKTGLALRNLYARLTGRKGYAKQQAKVAVARELAQLVYIIWKSGEAYHEPDYAGAGRSNRCRRQEQTPRQTLRSDQTPFPMVDQRSLTAGQALL